MTPRAPHRTVRMTVPREPGPLGIVRDYAGLNFQRVDRAPILYAHWGDHWTRPDDPTVAHLPERLRWPELLMWRGEVDVVSEGLPNGDRTPA